MSFGLFPDSESVSLHQTISGSGQNTQPAVVLISLNAGGDTLFITAILVFRFLRECLYRDYMCEGY